MVVIQEIVTSQKGVGLGSRKIISIWNFLKKTNEIESDWSDIIELHNVLHSPLRTTDVETWKTNLENVFDVQGFLFFSSIMY